MRLPSKRDLPRIFPWIPALAYRLRMVTNAAHRAAHREESAIYRRIESGIGGNFRRPDSGRANKKVLFFGCYGVAASPLERFVTAAFERAGFRPVVVLPIRAGPKIDSYRLLGLNDHVAIRDFEREIPAGSAARAMDGVRSLGDLLAISNDGVQVGKFTASTLMRHTRQGSPNLSDESIRALCRQEFSRSLAAADAARRMLDRLRPGAVVMLDRGYTPFGEMFDTCMKRDIPVFTWNAAHRNDLIAMKRYGVHNAELHHMALSAETWTAMKEMRWDGARWKELEEELVGGYERGEWFAEVGTQFNTRTVGRQSLIDRLELDAGKRTAVVFPHIFWDATFFWGKDLFGDYEEWFCECLRVACRNPRLNWIIKVHPANLVKDRRDGVSGEHSEITAIRKTVGALPPHVKLLPADTEVSTLSLFDIMDYCLTVRGTVGIEAACRGIPVLTAGTGRYDGLGFTRDFDTREDYLAQLERLETVPRLTPAETELARRYAYGVFITRPTKLTSVTYRFRTDAKASTESRLTVKNTEELLAAPDIGSIAEWIESGDDDYVTSRVVLRTIEAGRICEAKIVAMPN